VRFRFGGRRNRLGRRCRGRGFASRGSRIFALHAGLVGFYSVILVRFVVGNRNGAVAFTARSLTGCIRITFDPKFLLDRDRDVFVNRARVCFFLFDAKLGQ
jgi:hypothetical protein